MSPSFVLQFDQESADPFLERFLLSKIILWFSKPLIFLTEDLEWSIGIWLVNHSKTLNGHWLVNQSQIPHPSHELLLQLSVIRLCSRGEGWKLNMMYASHPCPSEPSHKLGNPFRTPVPAVVACLLISTRNKCLGAARWLSRRRRPRLLGWEYQEAGRSHGTLEQEYNLYACQRKLIIFWNISLLDLWPIFCVMA